MPLSANFKPFCCNITCVVLRNTNKLVTIEWSEDIRFEANRIYPLEVMTRLLFLFLGLIKRESQVIPYVFAI